MTRALKKILPSRQLGTVLLGFLLFFAVVLYERLSFATDCYQLGWHYMIYDYVDCSFGEGQEEKPEARPADIWL